MFFRECVTPGETKSLYRTLCFQFHPDTGHGDLEEMKIVNVEYHERLRQLDGQESIGSDQKVHTYHYNETTEREVAEMLAKVLKLGMDGVTVDVVGTWIWLSGDTKPYRDQLKWNKGAGLGFKWHSKRGKWYWKRYTGRRTRMSNMTYAEIQYAYGSKSYRAEDTETRAIA